LQKCVTDYRTETLRSALSSMPLAELYKYFSALRIN
jgi:hypothetical protein